MTKESATIPQRVVAEPRSFSSFVGQEMVKGHENGTNASLENLVNFFSNQTGR
jgi:hypothetical protein